jgi:hypothetical protein
MILKSPLVATDRSDSRAAAFSGVNEHPGIYSALVKLFDAYEIRMIECFLGRITMNLWKPLLVPLLKHLRTVPNAMLSCNLHVLYAKRQKDSCASRLKLSQSRQSTSMLPLDISGWVKRLWRLSKGPNRKESGRRTAQAALGALMKCHSLKTTAAAVPIVKASVVASAITQ